MKIDFISDINKENYYILDYDRVDRFMIKFAWASAILITLYSLALYFLAPANFYPSPFSWRVVNLSEVAGVAALAFLTAILMTSLRGRFKNHYFWRFIVANLQFVYPYLTVFISGGSIEWHFHFFIVFALLTLYADWRLGWWAIIAVALHHGILNFAQPAWVYFYGRNDVAFLAHAMEVLFMAIVTTKISENNRQIAEAARLLGKELDQKVERK